MNSVPFQLSELLPDFMAGFEFILSTDPTANSLIGFSSFWVILILTIFILGITYYGRRWWISRYRIKYFRKRILVGLTKDNVFSQLLVLRDRFEQPKTAPVGRGWWNRDLALIWQEFEESLVTDPIKGKVFNTLDAHCFFHAQNLAGAFLNNKVSTFLPSILTGLGVLGTFIGLTQGLAGITLAQEATVEELRLGISAMINGANVAFMTSLWGVALSLVFGTLLKIGESRLLGNLHELQSSIDYLFPRQTAEYSLLEIARNSEKSALIQSEMAEQITNSLQKSVEEATQRISIVLRDSLTELVTPIVKDVSSQAHATSQNALNQLVDGFMTGLGQKAQEQAEILDSAADKIQSVMQGVAQKISDLSQLQQNNMKEDSSRQIALQQMVENATKGQTEAQTRFLEVMQSQYEQQGAVLLNLSQDSFQRVAENISVSLEQHADRQSESLQKAAVKVDQSVNSVSDTLSALARMHKESLETAQQQQTGMQQMLSEATKRQADSHSELYSSLQKQSIEQGKVMQDFVSQSQSLLGSIKSVADGLGVSVTNVQESAKNFAGASRGLVQFQEAIASTISRMEEGLKSIISGVTDNTNNLEQQMINLSAMLKASELLYKQFQTIESTLSQTTEENLATAQEMNAAAAALMIELQATVSSFRESLLAAMNAYGDKVREQMNDRMHEWDTQTRDFCNNMVAAVGNMKDLVGELEQVLTVKGR